MTTLQQTGLLVWKNVLQKKRQWKTTLSEFLLPLGFVALVVWLQTLSPDETIHAKSYTCPRVSGVSPTLLFPEGINGSGFLFELDTIGIDGPGITTVPPIVYLFALASKIKFSIALVPGKENQTDVNLFLDEVYNKMDDFTKPFEDSWSILSDAMYKLFGFGLCRATKLVKRFNSSDELEVYIKSDHYGSSPWIGACPDALENPKVHMALVVDKVSTEGDGRWEYRIRTNTTVIPFTYPQMGYTEKFSTGVNQLYQDQYMMSGFLTLQHFVDRMIVNTTLKSQDDYVEDLAMSQLCDNVSPLLKSKFIPDLTTMQPLTQQLSGPNCKTVLRSMLKNFDLFPLVGPAAMLPNNIRVSPFPTPEYTDRSFYAKIKNVFALDLILTFLWPISRLIRGIVDEKETKTREGMKMMGLKSVSLYLSWFLTYGFIFVVIAASITLMTHNSLFSTSDSSLILAYFALFGISIIGYCFMISVVFDRAKTASTSGVVLFFMGFFFYFGVNNQNATAIAKNLACISAPAAFGIGAGIIATYEESGVGVTWANSYSTPNELSIPFIHVIYAFIFDTLLYMFLGYYLDNVLPQEYGLKKPWYFLFTLRFWSGKSTHEIMNSPLDVPLLESSDSYLVEDPSADLRQLESEGRCAKLQGLRKVFESSSGPKVAVDHLDLTMYEGQIFVLLGENGAGKSTTISIMTGLIPLTSGYGKILGMDIGTEMDTIRNSLGICPQHDVLFPDLTVQEHLEFFAHMKRVKNVALEVGRQIEQIGLTEKKLVLAKNLSGGQKRKLSVALALLGDSKVVFLDEPTSGMDVYSRRSMWNLLQSNRAGRIIILTTHFLAEADILGDRIAILSEGKLQCCGTSLFLKSKYGMGYSLSFSLHPCSDLKTTRNQLAKEISKLLPELVITSSIGTEITARIPFGGSHLFPNAFKALDQDKDRLGLATYGVSVTTLEEVFLKFADHSGKPKLQDETEYVIPLKPDPIQAITIHMKAMLIKRYHYSKRDMRSLCCICLMPILLLIFGLGLLKLFPMQEQPGLVLGPDQFSQTSNFLPVNISTPNDQEKASLFLQRLPTNFTPVLAVIPEGLSNVCVGDNSPEDISDGENIAGMSQWILDHQKVNASSMYGAIQVDAVTPGVEITFLVNSTAKHGPGTFFNVGSNAVLRYLKNAGSIQVTNEPLPFTANGVKLFDTFASVSAAISILIAFSFIPAAVAIFIVKERENSAKHQQIISGASILAYWLSSYIWDMLMFMVPWTCSLLCLYGFQISSYQGENLFATAVLFLCYGHGMIPFTYCVCFLFDSHSTAQNMLLLLNFTSGLILMIASFVMSSIDSTKDINATMVYLYRLFPGFCLGNGLLDLTVQHTVDEFMGQQNISPFAWDVLGANLAYLVAQGFMWFALTLIIDYSLNYPLVRQRFARLFKTSEESDRVETLVVQDEDVKLEQMRIDSDLLNQADDMLVLRHLRKVYGSKVAVNDLTFGVAKGACFGFLGVNGAGKTSTIKILTGDFLPTEGTASLADKDIIRNQSEIRRNIGYCPQFDALLEHLTVQEHLELFGRLKFIPEADLTNVVSRSIEEMNLVDFRDKTASTLSGGNKRKLSVAIALMGSPPLVFLDEPSTGMDVMNRRFMWQIISQLSSKGVTVFLTSHSMDECEALCSRIGIMVGGGLSCLGTIQHLKSRFGQGLIVDIKLTPKPKVVPELSRTLTKDQVFNVCTLLGIPSRWEQVSLTDPTGWVIASALEKTGEIATERFLGWWVSETLHDALETYILSNFPGSLCLEKRAINCKWRISESDKSLAQVFEIFESNKVELSIAEYSVCQTTLEQIFVRFASREDTARVGGILNV